MVVSRCLSGGLVAAALALTVAGAPAAGPAAQAATVCPSAPLSLQRGSVARAKAAALAAAPRLYRGVDTRGAKVVAAARADHAGARGAEVRRQCGARVSARTVVVSLRFPRMLPSASLSEGVVFVARMARGYRVWELAH
jgi:hypothetical protein